MNMGSNDEQGVDEASKTYHHGNLPEALLRSARELLQEEGLEALSLRAVARRAGVSQAAPYHHFKDKITLMAAVAEQGHRELATTCMEFYQPDLPGYEGLLTMGVGYLTFAKENPELFRLMFGAELSHYHNTTEEAPFLDALALSNKAIDDAVARAFDPELMADRAKFETAKRAAWSIVHGMGTLIVDGRMETPPTRTKAFMEFALSTFRVFDKRVFKRT